MLVLLNAERPQCRLITCMSLLPILPLHSAHDAHILSQQEARTQRVREYFYGPHGELSPHVLRLKFSEVSIFRVGGGPRAPTSALPIGGLQPACWMLCIALTLHVMC